MTEEQEKELRVRMMRVKIDLLMEEPCPIYEATGKDWEDFWYTEDK
jgi:hypothetical protein